MTVPESWSIATLAGVAKWGSGGTPQAGNPAFYGGGIPWAVIGDLNDTVVKETTATITQRGFESSSAKMVPEGAILIAMYGASIGKLGIAGKVMTTNQAIAFAIPGTKILARYLFYYLLSQRSAFIAAGKGAAQPNISQTILKAWPIKFPNCLDEQQRIVHLLDDHLSRLDDADRSLKSAVVRCRALIQSTIDKAVVGALNGGPTARDGLAEGWRWATPSEITDEHRANIVIGPFGSSLKTSDYQGSGVPLIFVRNVRSRQFGDAGRRYVSHAKAAELSAHMAVKGDVVVTKMGDPPGDAAVYDCDVPGIVTADVIRLRPGRGYSGSYISVAINSSHVARQIANITQGVAQKKVSLSRFRAQVRIPVPDLSTQIGVASWVDQMSEGVTRLLNQARTIGRQNAGLRQTLLTAAFTGGLTKRIHEVETREELTGV